MPGPGSHDPQGGARLDAPHQQREAPLLHPGPAAAVARPRAHGDQGHARLHPARARPGLRHPLLRLQPPAGAVPAGAGQQRRPWRAWWRPRGPWPRPARLARWSRPPRRWRRAEGVRAPWRGAAATSGRVRPWAAGRPTAATAPESPSAAGRRGCGAAAVAPGAVCVCWFSPGGAAWVFPWARARLLQQPRAL